MNNLANLERDVEMARARLAGNLSTLVSIDTYSALKEDVKDEAKFCGRQNGREFP